jgi:hypothetical protein
MATSVFTKVGTLVPFGAPVLRAVTITNSTTLTIADMVSVSAGFLLDSSGTTYPIFGNLASIETYKGVGLPTTGVAGASMGSFINSYLTASNNQTVAQVQGIVDISKNSLYTNATSGVLGTTTGSNLIGYYLNLVAGSAVTIDETSATTTPGTTEFFNWGLQPGSTTLIVVNLNTTAVSR